MSSSIAYAATSTPEDNPVWDAIAFHAHACAEKSLKALIVRGGDFPPRTHDMKQLLAQSGLAHDETLVAACQKLNDVLPKSRYPELPEPTAAEARDAVDAVRLVRHALGLDGSG